MPSVRQMLPAAALFALAVACAKKQTDDVPPSAGVATAASPAEQKPSLTACAMVTAAEMSKILGTDVAATPHEGTADQTECIYTPAAGMSPRVDFTVVRGDGEVAMTAAGAMEQHERGIATPYDGIGDQAVAVGPTLMIRNGEDLVQLVFTGVTDTPKAARQIFDTAKPRM